SDAPRVSRHKLESVSEVIATAGYERYPAPHARDAHQRGVKDRKPDQQSADEQSGVAGRRMPCYGHHERGHEKPGGHASAIAEENPRRPRQVEWQEPGAGPG